jgi:hypothetical protein
MLEQWERRTFPLISDTPRKTEMSSHRGFSPGTPSRGEPNKIKECGSFFSERNQFLGTLVPSGIHRTCRIVAGLAACSGSLPRKSKHGHTWPPPRARVDTVQNRPESRLSPDAKNWIQQSSSLRRQDHDRIRIKDLAVVAMRLRDAEAAVVDVLVEHRGNLEVIAGVGKRASSADCGRCRGVHIVLPSEPATRLSQTGSLLISH